MAVVCSPCILVTGVAGCRLGVAGCRLVPVLLAIVSERRGEEREGGCVYILIDVINNN